MSENQRFIGKKINCDSKLKRFNIFGRAEKELNEISNQDDSNKIECKGSKSIKKKTYPTDHKSSMVSMNSKNNEMEDFYKFSLSRSESLNSRASSFVCRNQTGHLINNILNTYSYDSQQLNKLIDQDQVPLFELVEANKLICIDKSYSIQKAFQLMESNDLTSVPVFLDRNSDDWSSCVIFDYNDLNTFLLLVMNKISIKALTQDELISRFQTISKLQEYVNTNVEKVKKGHDVPISFILNLIPKPPIIILSENDNLTKAMETFCNGAKRIAIKNENNKITGILSQRRLVKHIWELIKNFPYLDLILNSTLDELKVGSGNPTTINENQLLIDALGLMFTEKVSSIAVVDSSRSVVGNVSVVDIKNVSSSKNSHLLFKSVLNFISFNLSQKGVEEGQDQYPIFYVNNKTTLNKVIAKLVATQSHRLWIVESNNRSITQSSNSSFININESSTQNKTNVGQQPTSAQTSSSTVSQSGLSVVKGLLQNHSSTSSGMSNFSPHTSSECNYNNSNKLIGVVSLSDILALILSVRKMSQEKKLFNHEKKNEDLRNIYSYADN